jgi:phage FluMu protein Com
MENAMDRVTRCLHCGKRMVLATSCSGRTELKCVFCEKVDPMAMVEPNKWADGPLATPISGSVQ